MDKVKADLDTYLQEKKKQINAKLKGLNREFAPEYWEVLPTIIESMYEEIYNLMEQYERAKRILEWILENEKV